MMNISVANLNCFFFKEASLNSYCALVLRGQANVMLQML